MIDGGRHEYWEGNSKFCMRKERMWWNGFSGRVLEVRVHKGALFQVGWAWITILIYTIISLSKRTSAAIILFVALIMVNKVKINKNKQD